MILHTLKKRAGAAGLALAGLIAGTPALAAPVDISFYFPVAIGGPVTKIIDEMVADFQSEHPDIRVQAVYSGTYNETAAKSLTAARSGKPPAAAIMLSTEMYTLRDQDVLVPIDTLVKTDEDRAWLQGFFPGFMRNSQSDGQTWGIPFQRSTSVFFWNKDAFREAGLDPERGPQTWDEVTEFADKLTKKDDKGNVVRWGMQVPSSLTAYWLLQGYVAQNGGKIASEDGKQTYFNSPEVVEAMQFWVDLGGKHKVMRPGAIEWATTPKDFFEGRTAMMTTTTGNLTNVRANAPFPFGVAMLPAGKQRGTPTGGGNIYLFKDATPEEQQAAFTLAKWLTSAERAAQWGIRTGYVAVRPDAWETPAMQAYVAEFPAAAVARDQLEYAVAELSTHDNQRVARLIDDNIEAALTGRKTAQQAMDDAQAESERILRRYR